MTPFDKSCVGVVELYLKYLGRRVQGGVVKKINLELEECAKCEAPQASAPHDVVYISWPFRFDLHRAAGPELEARRLVLDALHSALVWYARQSGWVEELFVKAYAECLQCDIVYRDWLLPRSVKSRDRTHAVNVMCEYKEDHIDIVAVLFSKDGQEIRRVPVYEHIIHYDQRRQMVDRIAWHAKRRVRIYPGSWLLSVYDVDFNTGVAEVAD
jgi:hypothetical protein